MEETKLRTTARKYLLGDLSEDERTIVEERYLSSPDYQESVLIAEDELIDDYLDGLLDKSEEQRFKTYFLATPQQRKKLRIAQSIKRYAGTNTWVILPDPNDAPIHDLPRPLRPRLWFEIRRPATLVPLLMAVFIVIIASVVGVKQWRQARERGEEQAHHAQIEQDLAQANQSSTQPVLSVLLPPVTTRSPGDSNRFAAPQNDGMVELQMIVIGEKYPNYQASLQLPGVSQPVTITHLNPPGPTGHVTLRIPGHLLKRSSYQVQLFGVKADGSTEFAGEYSFQVTSAPGQ
jgi:hypothetical protein